MAASADIALAAYPARFLAVSMAVAGVLKCGLCYVWLRVASPRDRKSAPETARRPPPRSASRRKRERRRQEAMRALSHPRRGSRTLWLAYGVGGLVILGAVLAIVLLTRGTTTSIPPSSNTTGPTPAGPALASVNSSATGQPVTVPGGPIQCEAMEQVAYHIHAHLAVFVNGSQRVVPEGVGIGPPRTEVQTDEGPYASGTCYYWLHTHTDDGIIHIESPSTRTYTLGDFFAIWNQPLTTDQVGPASGTLYIYVAQGGGTFKRFTGDPRTITLTAHELIQIDVGVNVTPLAFTFPPGL